MDKHNNIIAQEGCDRCFCGCKYWENDRCIDCKTHASAIPEVRVRLLQSQKDYLEKVRATVKANPHLRYGQTLVNLLSEFSETVYRKYTVEIALGSNPDLDPFYKDENVPNFLAFVYENWNKPREQVTCARCGQTFTWPVTGHTEDNPCEA